MEKILYLPGHQRKTRLDFNHFSPLSFPPGYSLNQVKITLNHHYFYSATHLNKLLFKKRCVKQTAQSLCFVQSAISRAPHRRGNDVYHRYHRLHPITVLNPLTNSEILGEVFVPLLGRVVAAAVRARASVLRQLVIGG